MGTKGEWGYGSGELRGGIDVMGWGMEGTKKRR